MGLLDDFKSFINTPEGVGLLSTVFGGLAGAQRGAPLNNIGRAGMSGLMGYSNAQDQQNQNKQADQMKQLRDFQIADMQRKQADEQTIRQAVSDAYQSPGSQAISLGSQGPTNANASLIPLFKPKLDVNAAVNKIMAVNPVLAMQLKKQLTPEPIKLGSGDTLLDPNTYQPLATGSGKNEQFTLPPGSVRYDSSGKQIAAVPMQPNYNQPFLPNGKPNLAYQNYELRAKGMPVDTPSGTGASNLNGQEYLSTLPKAYGDQVKALAEGRLQFPAGFALKSPYWQQMISAVSQYDPNFDAVNYNARSQTRNDFTKGKSADNITALNTAMQHLGKLSDAFSQLGNTSTPGYNKLKNYLGNQLGNEKIQKNYAAVSTDATAVSHEIAKVFRQSGMSEAEINDWQNKINPNASPAQMKSVIESALGLMEGRLQALGARYNQGMGTTKNPLELLTPEAQKTWNKLNANASGNVAAPQNVKFLGFE